jgi:NADPH-dependent 2,4-dienoyl-CoA reductase/sulfur reductase-like enzyme
MLLKKGPIHTLFRFQDPKTGPDRAQKLETHQASDPEPQSHYDIIVIGGGGHGLATAHYLAKVYGQKAWR